MAYQPYEVFLDSNDHSSRVYGTPETRRPYDGDVSPSFLSFGSVDVGKTATLVGAFTNAGYRTLPITEINVVGDFEVTTTCPIGGELGVGASCSLSVKFKPTRGGTTTGGVYVNTGNAAGMEFIRLTGLGVGGTVVPPDPGTDWNHTAKVDAMLNDLWGFLQRAVRPALTVEGPAISLPSSSLVFNTEVTVGEESALTGYTVQNTGNAELILDNLNVTGEFELAP